MLTTEALEPIATTLDRIEGSLTLLVEGQRPLLEKVASNTARLDRLEAEVARLRRRMWWWGAVCLFAGALLGYYAHG